MTTATTTDLRAYYEQEYLRHHPEMDVNDVPGKFEALHPFLEEAARATPAGLRRVVEIGCGSGTLLRLACRYLEARGIGVDLSAAVLAGARRMSPGLAFVQANAEQLPLRLAQCDLVLFADLVEHVPHPHAFLRGLRAAPHVVMLVPLESGWLADLVYRYRRLVGKPTNYETCGHLHRWTAGGALRLLRAAGLKVVTHRVQCGKFTLYTTWRGRLYGGLSQTLYRVWPWLHQRLFGACTLLALCRPDERLGGRSGS